MLIIAVPFNDFAMFLKSLDKETQIAGTGLSQTEILS